MSLSWSQIRTNAAAFSEKWQGGSYERGEDHSFYNDFFEVFGIKRRSVARYEEHVRKLNNASGFIDLFWPSVLLVEHKSAGGNLEKAAEQAGEYFDAILEEEKPRYQLVCDFQTFGFLDRDTGVSCNFPLADLHKHVELFAFMIGKQTSRDLTNKEPVNRKASDLVAAIYEGLTRSGYPREDLEKCLTRLIFCLYADDTGIFQPRGCFFDLLEARTNSDGSDIGTWLYHLFKILDTPVDLRQGSLDDDLAQFPYINGSLFSEEMAIPCFDERMRKDLLAACQFDWSVISPAIFGSLFQSVLSSETRREIGGYFTSEENILKVIEELFLRKLQDEFAQISQSRFGRIEALREFQRGLGELRFLDPACGCGNFLAIAYRELRKLELAVLKVLREAEELDLTSPELSLVDVDQFFGVEIREYSARIARAAMWMTDHTANNELSLALGVEYHRVPLRKSPEIRIENALVTDWTGILPPDQCSFILGNPPYIGSKNQSQEQRSQIKSIAMLGGSGGTLDYACGWMLKAAEYAVAGTEIGLVVINSVTQGEQAGQLWPVLFDRFALEISFAHQAFAWESGGAGRPRVHVTIIGLVHRSRITGERHLYRYRTATDEAELTICQRISPYLISGDGLRDSHTVVKKTSRPINGLERLRTGTKPIDGGYYILTDGEKTELLAQEPGAAKLVRPFVGAEELLSGNTRSILFLSDTPPSELRSLPTIRHLIRKVRDYRLGQITNKVGNGRLAQPNPLSETPTRFHITAVPTEPFLVIPEVGAERRDYVPIAWLTPPTIPSNLVKYLAGATLSDFALLTSAMHMSWLAIIGGRLEGRNRYSIQIVYNTFPIADGAETAGLAPLAQGVLDARSRHSGQALRDLYDPDVMPMDLRTAHRRLDDAVDRLYLGRAARDVEDRVEHLLRRYEDMVSP